jgi:hypothetical protein
MSFVPATEDKKFIRRLAAESDTSMSEIVRAIVRKFVHDNAALSPEAAMELAVQNLTSYLDLTKTRSL